MGQLEAKINRIQNTNRETKALSRILCNIILNIENVSYISEKSMNYGHVHVILRICASFICIVIEYDKTNLTTNCIIIILRLVLRYYILKNDRLQIFA